MVVKVANKPKDSLLTLKAQLVSIPGFFFSNNWALRLTATLPER